MMMLGLCHVCRTRERVLCRDMPLLAAGQKLVDSGYFMRTLNTDLQSYLFSCRTLILLYIHTFRFLAVLTHPFPNRGSTTAAATVMSVEPPPAKRQRADTLLAVPSSTTPPIRTMLGAFTAEEQKNLLFAIASSHPAVVRMLHQRYVEKLATDAAKVINFDQYSKSAWYILNVKYSRISGSKQCEVAGDAFREIQDTLRTIEDLAPAHASFGTKKSALETLRKIGKSICLGRTDVLGSEMIKSFQSDGAFVSIMLKIACSLSDEDKTRMMADEEFESKLTELEILSKNQYVFEDLYTVRFELLSGLEEGGEDEEGEGDGEEDDNDDNGNAEPPEDSIQVTIKKW
jgi:hypothetical protein